MKLNCREKQIFAADNTQNQFAEFAMQFLSHIIRKSSFQMLFTLDTSNSFAQCRAPFYTLLLSFFGGEPTCQTFIASVNRIK